MNFGAFTDPGMVREENEDSLYIPDLNDKLQIFMVSDGIGGQNHGEVASKMTIDGIVNYLKNGKNENIDELIAKSIKNVNKTIYNMSNKQSEYKGMGATLVLLLKDNNLIKITHAGDSRCYIIRNSIISQLTVDNSYVEYLLQKGVINMEEAKNHPQKNLITKAIGMDDDIEIDVESIECKTGDTFLLCSDGLTSMLSDEEILNIIINKKGNMQSATKSLVMKAKECGGYDNITAILLEV